MSIRVSSSEMLERQQCLDDLDDYINSCQADISNMLDTLEWTPDHFVQPRSRRTCPYNSDHKMPPDSMANHVPVCRIICQGCSRKEAENIVEDTSYAYQQSTCVHTEPIDIEKMNAVLWNYHVKNNSVFYGYKKMPLTPEQEEGMLSRVDRLGMTEFIVNKAKEANRLKELGKDELLVSENLADLVRKEDEERQLDHVEELAALRDYRRRRQTYRAKNVHITKKSHTEILREVITNQMEMYARSLQDQDPADSESFRSDLEDHRHMMEDPMASRSGTDSRGASNYAEKSRYREERHHRRRSRSQEDRGHTSSKRRKRSASRDRRSNSRDQRPPRSRDSKTSSRTKDRQRSKSRDRKRSTSPDRSVESGKEMKTVMRMVHDGESPSHVIQRDTTEQEALCGDRARDRSRSYSRERHKKSKHKKHKKKHKKKHHRSDSRDHSPGPAMGDT